MKKIVLCLMLACSFVTRAQDVQEPEFANRPYSVSADGSLKNLERVDAQQEVKGGMGGSEIFHVAFGDKSTFRTSKAPRFIIKVDAGVDPAEKMKLSKAEIKKGKRRFLAMSMSSMGKARDVSESLIRIEFKKIRDGVYEILLPAMQSGEYGFIFEPSMTETNPKINCFGID